MLVASAALAPRQYSLVPLVALPDFLLHVPDRPMTVVWRLIRSLSALQTLEAESKWHEAITLLAIEELSVYTTGGNRHTASATFSLIRMQVLRFGRRSGRAASGPDSGPAPLRLSWSWIRADFARAESRPHRTAVRRESERACTFIY